MNWPVFTSPWLLAGLAAVGLPVLIHYLTRARPRRIAFPPYRFLVEACAGRQAVHRLRTFILLAVRCLAVLFLVLLFTRPFLKPAGAASGADASKRVVLIVDASLSMRAVQRGVPLFARAQSEAADVLRSLDSGSEAAVILAGSQPRPLLPALSRNISALHEELIKSQPTCEAGDPAAALALAARMLNGRGAIDIFSDFQESNWKSLQGLPPGLPCTLRPVTAGSVDNLALTAVEVVPSAPVAGETAEVVCTVFNSTPAPRKESVRLELGELAQDRPVTVPAFGSAQVAYSISFPAAGVFTGKASLQTDNLREDDSRFVAVRVHKALQLLLISDADAADTRSAAFFIGRALVPSPEAAPGLNLVRRHSQDADRGALETADVFVLTAPAMLTGESLEVISRRLNDGAALIVCLDAPNAQLLAPPVFSPPFILAQPVRTEGGESLVPGVRKLFADSDSGELAGLKFHRHYRTQIREAHEGDVLLSHQDGSAALTISTAGKGLAAFVNIPLTPDDGDLIGSPMFPALLHELLRHLRRGVEEQLITPGSAWTLEAPSTSDSPIKVLDPDGRNVDARIISSGRLSRFAMPIASKPGLYLALQSGATVAATAVNVDPRESDTRPIALERIERLPGGVSVSVAHNEDSLVGAVKTRPLWPALAAAAACFIGLEMLLLMFWRSPRGAPLPARAAEAGA